MINSLQDIYKRAIRMSASYSRITPEMDAKFGDFRFEISKTDKRWLRATVKTYEKTGTYIFLKLFKRDDDNFVRSQNLTLSMAEWERLLQTNIMPETSAIPPDDIDDDDQPLRKHKSAKRQKAQ